MLNPMVAITAKLLILINLVTYCHASLLPYEVTPVDTHAGIFYQNLGTTKISHDYFTLLSFTNLSIYQEQLELIKTTYSRSINLCRHPNENLTQITRPHRFACNEHIETLKYQITRLDEKFETISHLTSHDISNIRRSKRGLIDGVSYAFKWLFGIPDADDAKYYADAISTVEKQNHDVQMLMKQQIHIISEAISDYNKSAIDLKLNQERLNANILKFNRFEKETVFVINSMTYFETVTDHLNFLTHLITELNEEYDVITSAILFSKQNIIHPSVITPKHLREELLKIKINTNFEFPISLDNYENSYKYFTICTLSVIYFNKILVYAIKIPIVSRDLYQLYNLMPLPIQMMNSSVYSFIDPSFPYLLLSTSRTHYGQLKDLSTCQELPPAEFICSQTTVHLTKQRPVCETELKLKQLHSIPSVCKTRTMKTEVEIWHPLSTNHWLFIVTEPTIGTINCEGTSNSVLDVEFQGTGILQLRPRCKCYTTSTLLVSTSNQTTNYTNYIPNINIIGDDCCLKEQQFLVQNEEMEPLRLHDINLDDLRHAKHKLQQYDEILQQNLNKPFIIQHTKWYNVLFGILTVILSLLLFWYCCGKCCRWRFIAPLKRFFTRENCQKLICINSHNTISQSSLNTQEFSLRRLRSLEMMERLDANEEPDESSEDINPQSQMLLRSHSRKGLKI